MDNGSGSALLLDLARSLKQAAPPKRSVLFVWVTAEEKGLLGSRYFTAHPTVPASSMVADINTDEFLPIVPLKVLTVFGLSESDLGEADEVVDLDTVCQRPGKELRAEPSTSESAVDSEPGQRQRRPRPGPGGSGAHGRKLLLRSRNVSLSAIQAEAARRFCSRLAMAGATTKAIQVLAGHANISTTERYMHLAPGRAEDAVRLLG